MDLVIGQSISRRENPAGQTLAIDDRRSEQEQGEKGSSYGAQIEPFRGRGTGIPLHFGKVGRLSSPASTRPYTYASRSGPGRPGRPNLESSMRISAFAL